MFKNLNGLRVDNINNLNYLKLIKDNLQLGLLNRADSAWGTSVLIGISLDNLSETVLDGISNIKLNDDPSEEYYVKLYNEGGEDLDASEHQSETPNTGCHLWKIIKINDKWMLIENTSTDVTGVDDYEESTYTNFLQNISVASYTVDIYQYTGTFTKLNFDDLQAEGSKMLIVPIRYRNPDLDFYNVNKEVYLASSGMNTSFEGFEELILLENSQDYTSIKIVNVPDSIIAQIENGTISLEGRRFDVMDSNSNKILLKGIMFDTIISFNDVKLLKFIYPTQRGDKVVLATNNVYDNIYCVYPDYTVDLLTEMINDNLPPGIDMALTIDNSVIDSLFIPDASEETFDYTHFNHWDFISDSRNTVTVYFCSLANEKNRLIDGTNGFYLDDSVYVALPYSVANWDKIKESNLNNLLINIDFSVIESATEPDASESSEFDIWNDPSEGLKMYNGVDTWVPLTNMDIRQIALFYINGTDRDLIYVSNINKIVIDGTLNIQIII